MKESIFIRWAIASFGLFIVSNAKAAIGTTSAGDPETWTRRDYSVIVAKVTEVRPAGGADKGLYSATLTPIATIAGRLDPSAQPKVPVNLYVGSLSSSVKKTPPDGATVLVAVERNVKTGDAQAPAHWIDPNVCPFMPDEAGLVVLSGIDDRRIAETLERIRDARAGELPKSLRDALKPTERSGPAKGK